MNSKTFKKAEKWLDALEVAINYERKSGMGVNNNEYAKYIMATIGNNIQSCSNCSGVMLKNHNDFVTRIWKELHKIDDKLVPQLPVFNTSRFSTQVWQDSLRFCSFSILLQQKNKLLAEAKQYSRSKNTKIAQDLENDANLLMQYYSTKISYFENYFNTLQKAIEAMENKEIALEYDINHIITMLNNGITRHEICNMYKLNIKHLNKEIKKYEDDKKTYLIEQITKNAQPKTKREEVFFAYMRTNSMERVAEQFNIPIQSVEYCIKDVLMGDIEGDIVYPHYYKDIVLNIKKNK